MFSIRTVNFDDMRNLSAPGQRDQFVATDDGRFWSKGCTINKTMPFLDEDECKGQLWTSHRLQGPSSARGERAVKLITGESLIPTRPMSDITIDCPDPLSGCSGLCCCGSGPHNRISPSFASARFSSAI